MKNFPSYLPLIALAGFIGYIFFKELVILAIIILLIIFRNEILGLGALAQIIAVVVGIPYLFFTDTNFRSWLFEFGLFIGGIFLIGYLLERHKINKENDNATTEEKQINKPQTPANSSEFYQVNELQSRFEKQLTVVENAGAANKWKYGRDYERYIGYLFEREGFQVIYNGATRGSSDGGIDLFCLKDGIVYPIQCKRWKNKVDEKEIDKFIRAVNCCFTNWNV